MSQIPENRTKSTDRLFNGRVLLEFAAQEIAAAGAVDAGELRAAIRATGDVLAALCSASRTLGVEPPQLPKLESWARHVARLAETR